MSWPPPPSIASADSTNTEGGSSSVSRARVEEGRDRAEPLERRGRPRAGVGGVPRQHRVQPLEEMVDPEDRVPLVRPLVLQPEDRAPELAQQRGAVDLLLQVLDVELLDRARHRPERRDVRPDGGHVEAAQPAVVRHQPGLARGGRVEVVLEIQVGLAELVDRRHPASRDREWGARGRAGARRHAGGFAATSE